MKCNNIPRSFSKLKGFLWFMFKIQTNYKIYSKNTTFSRPDIPNYLCQLAAYSVKWEERTGMPVTNLIVIMDVDNFHPVTYKEHRDNWIPMLKDTIKEYEHRKMYRP